MPANVLTLSFHSNLLNNKRNMKRTLKQFHSVAFLIQYSSFWKCWDTKFALGLISEARKRCYWLISPINFNLVGHIWEITSIYFFSSLYWVLWWCNVLCFRIFDKYLRYIFKKFSMLFNALNNYFVGHVRKKKELTTNLEAIRTAKID